MTSCFEDDSKEGQPISDITIADFEESTYSKVSFKGQTLVINPTIDTEYAESDLEYEWTIVPIQDHYATKEFEQPVVISTEKNLNYEVSLAPKSYTVCLKVSSKSNGYTVTKTATLIANSEFSQGFYILKENAEGNSELDLLLKDGSLSENLLSGTRSEGALKGAPRNLTIAYGHNYIDEETSEISGANMVCVTTEERNISLFRTTDLKEVYNQDNMFYNGFGADEEPYGVQTVMYSMCYFSNKGVASAYPSYVSSYYTGKYGISPEETGGSVYMASTPYVTFYWDAQGHKFYGCDYNGGLSLVTESDGTLLQLDNYECVGAGRNVNTGALFVLQDKTTKDRIVYEVNEGGTFEAKYPIESTKHIAKSDIVRVNALQGFYMYSVDNNKLYGYDWTSGDEKEMELQGIGSGETINYVSNQFIVPGMFGEITDDFDYLVIGTKSGNNEYHLYFYEMVGGQPDGKPVLQTSGTGRVNNIRFVTPNFSMMDACYSKWVVID